MKTYDFPLNLPQNVQDNYFPFVRCLCPGRSWGPRCKVLARTFSGSSWAWVRPLPPCLPTTISLRLLPRFATGLILYSGPLSSTSNYPHWSPAPMLALQLVEGRPEVILEGSRGSLKLQVDTTLQSGTWHTLHLHLDAQVCLAALPS